MQMSTQSSLQSGFHANEFEVSCLDKLIIAIRDGERLLLLLAQWREAPLHFY